MKKCSILQKKGFTLLELMIALSILMVVLLGSANMLIVSVQWNTLSMEKAIAARLAKNKIDELRSRGYNQVGLKIDSHADHNNPLNADETPDGIYTRTWLVSSGKMPGTKKVRVVVTWYRGRLMLDALIADQG
jgi:prepilin-type N-terminal cleavage/methylation domain-containing protein